MMDPELYKKIKKVSFKNSKIKNQPIHNKILQIKQFPNKLNNLEEIIIIVFKKKNMNNKRKIQKKVMMKTL